MDFSRLGLDVLGKIYIYKILQSKNHTDNGDQ